MKMPETLSFETKKVPLAQSVLVVGGGLAGMTTAQALQRCGYAVTVVEHAAASGSALIGLTGQIGAFSARIKTREGAQTVSCGVVVIAAGTLVPAKISDSAHIFAIAEIDLALADLVKRKGVRVIGLILDWELDETKASTEMALALAKKIQQMHRYQVSLFCREVRVAAKDMEARYDEVREMGVNIVKYDGKLALQENAKGVAVTYFDSILRQELTMYCDRAGVSPAGISMSADPKLAAMTGIATDAYGQFQENNIHLFPGNTNRPGIFVVGPCRGQYYLPQIITEAKATALEVHALLSQKFLEVELSNAVVDPDKCVLCLTCVRSCPYKAMHVNREKGAAESIPEACQKCGLCAGECPAKAIELPRYADKILLSQIR